MDKNESRLTDTILNLTLEIIYLLTGEHYIVVKKEPCKTVTASSRRLCVSGGWSRTQSPIAEPPLHPVINERDNEQKILGLTNKIIQLLTVEGQEYVAGNYKLSKDVTMKNHRPLTSLDGSSSRNVPERCVGPLYSQDGTEEDHHIPQDDKGENLIQIKVEELSGEEMYMTDYQQCKEEQVPTGISTGGHSSKDTVPYELHIVKQEFNDFTEDPGEENLISPKMHSIHHSTNVSPDHHKYRGSYPDIVAHNTVHGDEERFAGSEYQKRVTQNAKTHTCPDCGKCFTQKGNLVQHQRIHTGERPFACPVCEKCFTQKASLIEHQRIHTGEKPFSCSHCGKCFTHKSQFNRHQRIHTGEKPFLCSECGKCFTQSTHLVEHQKIHTGVKQYPCTECGKRFTHRSVLVKHQRIHTGEKPFSCTECGECFAQKLQFVSHQRIHTGEKPFTCSECGKCFTQKSYVAEHQKIHSAEKSFLCFECGKSFTHKTNLVVHQRGHTGEKPFPCSECGKRFTHKSNLVVHERAHRGEKPFQCPECEKCFAHKSRLVKHQKSHVP